MNYLSVSSWQNDETSVLVVDVFHGRPAAHDSFGRSEREVMKILKIKIQTFVISNFSHSISTTSKRKKIKSLQRKKD
jgi:hypothetical protein